MLCRLYRYYYIYLFKVLRTEVVHLRDEVKILKTLALNRVPVQKPMTDAETMTDPM